MDSGAPSGGYRTIADLLEGKEDRTLAVLRKARALIVREGWMQRESDLRLDEPRQAGWTLHYAIAEAGLAGIESEWARVVVRKLTGLNIPAWNDHPYRTKADVVAVLDRAIELTGGRRPRRGGPVVSHGPRGAR